MSDISDFIIENGKLTKYVGDGGEIIIPESVTEISGSAFMQGDYSNGMTNLPHLKIYTPAGSYAEMFAKAYSISYETI